MNRFEHKLILGTVQFGLDYGINNINGKMTSEKVYEILNFAHLNKISCLDTADAYGDSQLKIGQFHKKSPVRFKIFTKFKGVLENNLIEHTKKTIDLLNVDLLEAVSLHDFKEVQQISLMNQYEKLKALNLSKKIGVSVYTPAECLSALNYEFIDIIQIPFNILDNTNRWAEAFSAIKNTHRNIEIHSRSCFLQGLLYKNIQRIQTETPYLSELTNYIQPLQNQADLFNVSLAEYSLSYCLQNKNINHVLIGIDSIEQLQKNISYINSSPSDLSFTSVDSTIIKNADLLNPSQWPALREKFI